MRQYKCEGCGVSRPCYIEINQDGQHAEDEIKSLSCTLNEYNENYYDWKQISIESLANPIETVCEKPTPEDLQRSDAITVQLEKQTNAQLIKLYDQTQGFTKDIQFYVGDIRFELTEMLGRSKDQLQDGEPWIRFTFESEHERRVKTWVI